MALSFNEKRGFQKTVQNNLASLAKGGLTFIEKREMQKAISYCMEKLGEDLTPPPSLESSELPAGWTESTPGGLATNNDPVTGGIVDNEIVSGDWFVIANNDAVEKLTGFKTRTEAFTAFAAALEALQKPNSNFSENAEKEMVNAIVNYGGEVTGKQLPVVFFMFYGGVSAKLTVTMSEDSGKVAGYVGKNIDTGEESSLLFTAEQTMEWLIGNAKDNDAKQYQNQDLTDLIAGKYDSLEPLAFLGKLKDISATINDLEPLKEPAIKYITANADKAGAIMESAFQEAFGKMWGDAAIGEQMILEAAGRKGLKAMLFPLPTSPSTSPIMVEGGDGAPLKITIEIDGDFTEPSTFRDRIQAIESAKAEEEIILRINSNGGSTMSAQAFYSALLKTKARTKAVIINAYSSGSIVAMACDEIELTPFCSMMIHNASGGTGGKLGDMAGYVTFKNEYFVEWYAELYAGFLNEEELKDIAKGQDFWLKEAQIRERLKNWQPIRARLQADGSIVAV